MTADALLQAAFRTVDRVRRGGACRVTGADALVGGGHGDHRWTSRTPRAHDNQVIIPMVLVVVMLILMVLLRAVLAPLS